MKYSFAVKFIAVLLAAVCLLATLGSALGIIVLISYDLYSRPVEEVVDSYHYFDRQDLAINLIRRYGSVVLGAYPSQFYDEYVNAQRMDKLAIKAGHYDYTIFDAGGVPVETTYDENQTYASTWEIHREMVNCRNTKFNENIVPNVESHYDEARQRYVEVKYVFQSLEDYTVRLYLKEDAYTATSYWTLLTVLYGIRHWLFAIFGGALLLTAILMIYLCRAAGRTSGSDEIKPRGLSRLPLDLYTAGCAIIAIFGIWLGAYLFEQILDQAPFLLAFLAGLDAVILGLIFVGLIMAWAAQIKMKHHYWLKNTLIGRIVHLILRGTRWVLGRIRRLVARVQGLFRLLPMIWQLLATMALMVICPILCIIFANLSSYRWDLFWAFAFVGCLLSDLLIALYMPVSFVILFQGVKKMRQGDLTVKINTRFLFGSFREFAVDLNNLSDTIAVAVREQMRSERMKAELITNISHDIKTPLTSIINFVDLLQKPHTEDEQQEYLAVLSRQSGQMKKLIEDLTELSKATTGNLTVNPQKMDVAEAVSQALGEFSGKLDGANLTPVFRRPEDPVYIMADGRLVWRVLSNLLNNAVKYALPGTRLYMDLAQKDEKVTLSLKNVSKEELTATADELLERFVQGDASRNTEGSGLGLNIAKSLMESQQGTLDLLLDGDLFKVILTFPPAE